MIRARLSGISAFVPAYNEAASIERVIGRIHHALDRVANAHEIIVVVHGGSTDGTDAIVRRLTAGDSRLSLLVQPRERAGYGVALRMGIQAARHDFIFYTDADEQFDPEEIDRLVDLIETCDVATGYRAVRRDRLGRRLAAWTYNRIVDAVLHTGVRDVDCAFKLFRRDAFDGIALTCMTGLIDPEVVSKARRAGRRVGEVAVTHYPRTQGTPHFESAVGLPAPRVVLGVLRELWHLSRSRDR